MRVQVVGYSLASHLEQGRGGTREWAVGNIFVSCLEQASGGTRGQQDGVVGGIGWDMVHLALEAREGWNKGVGGGKQPHLVLGHNEGSGGGIQPCLALGVRERWNEGVGSGKHLRLALGASEWWDEGPAGQGSGWNRTG
jgi:hypothetical protein